MNYANDVLRELAKHKNAVKAKNSSWFFKCAPGEYGEGDIFWGIAVSIQRSIATRYKEIPLTAIHRLLSSPVHEVRLTAVFILVIQYRKSNLLKKKEYVDFYLDHLRYINNWDLVDSSAASILGDYLTDKPKEILQTLARSSVVWDRRIAMLSTFACIKRRDYVDALNIAEILLQDNHDLIQKAVGWMLREIGNRDYITEVNFLDSYAATIPRTTLRYAIEKLPRSIREKYLLVKRIRREVR